MLSEYLDRTYPNFIISFGKYRGKLLRDADVSYIAWWVNKREKDETHGTYISEIDLNHKESAEKYHQFNTTYVYFIWHLYKVYGIRCEGKGVYKRLTDQFWDVIDGKKEIINKIYGNELHNFLYSLKG